MIKRSGLLIVLLAALFFNISCADQNQLKGDTIETLAGQFVELLTKEDFSSAVKWFDDTMSSALPEPSLKQTWESVISQTGRFKKQVKSKIENIQGYKRVSVTCEFEKANLDIQVAFDNQNKVAGLFMVPAK